MAGKNSGQKASNSSVYARRVQKIWEHTLPFEKLVVKSTSLSNLMVNGSFLARFFLFCWSAVDIEFANPKLCINEKKKR